MLVRSATVKQVVEPGRFADRWASTAIEQVGFRLCVGELAHTLEGRVELDQRVQFRGVKSLPAITLDGGGVGEESLDAGQFSPTHESLGLIDAASALARFRDQLDDPPDGALSQGPGNLPVPVG